MLFPLCLKELQQISHMITIGHYPFHSASVTSTSPINSHSWPLSIYPALSDLAQFQSDLLANDKVERWLSAETEERGERTFPALCNTDDTRWMEWLICCNSARDGTTDMGNRSGDRETKKTGRLEKGEPKSWKIEAQDRSQRKRGKAEGDTWEEQMRAGGEGKMWSNIEWCTVCLNQLSCESVLRSRCNFLLSASLGGANDTSVHLPTPSHSILNHCDSPAWQS